MSRADEPGQRPVPIRRAPEGFIGEAERKAMRGRSADGRRRFLREAMLAVLPVFRHAVARVLDLHAADSAQALAVSVPLVKLCGLVLGGWLMARSADAAAGLLDAGRDRDFARAKLKTARFYVTNLLPRAQALAAVIDSGAAAVTDYDPALV